MLKSSKTTAVIILIVLAQIVLIGGMYLFKLSHKSERVAMPSIAPSPSVPVLPAYDFEVLYTAKGFEPSLFDVPVGSRVSFKNLTHTPLLVASDPYPSHSDYPQLVSPAGFGYGDSFVFLFDHAGSFGFGNDEQQNDRGLVRVLDTGAEYDADDKTPETQWKIRDTLYAMLLPGHPEAIFKVIDTIQSDGALSRNCHSLAHDLGHYAYNRYGFSGAMNISDATRLNKASVQDVCAGGYVHGILEEAALHRPDFADDPGILCESVPADSRSSCLHGLGHALMFSYGRDLAASAQSCRSLKHPGDKYPCFEGVYMEFFWGSLNYASRDALGWDLSKPLSPCLTEKGDARPACFLYSVFGYLRTHFQDYSGAIELCTTNGLNGSDVEYCMKGVGITMISHFSGHNLEKSEPFVSGLSDEHKRAFYKGLLGYGRFSGISKKTLQSTCDLLVNDKDLCNEVLSGTS